MNSSNNNSPQGQIKVIGKVNHKALPSENLVMIVSSGPCFAQPPTAESLSFEDDAAVNAHSHSTLSTPEKHALPKSHVNQPQVSPPSGNSCSGEEKKSKSSDSHKETEKKKIRRSRAQRVSSRD